jgi:hypothetical protein
MSKDWLARSKAGKLAQSAQQLTDLADFAPDYGVPSAEVTAYIALRAAAEAAYTKTQDKPNRTKVDVVVCNEAFKAMDTKMRFLYHNYFNSPPRTAEERTRLGLPILDNTKTDVPTPQNTAGIETRPLSNGQIELSLSIIGTSDSAASDYEFKVFLGIEDAAATGMGKFGRYLGGPPVSGKELT